MPGWSTICVIDRQRSSWRRRGVAQAPRRRGKLLPASGCARCSIRLAFLELSPLAALDMYDNERRLGRHHRRRPRERRRMLIVCTTPRSRAAPIIR